MSGWRLGEFDDVECETLPSTRPGGLLGWLSVRGGHGSVAGDLGCPLRTDQADFDRRILDRDRQFEGAEDLLSGEQRLVAVGALPKEALRGGGEIAIVIDLSRCLGCTRIGILERGASIPVSP